MSYSSQVKFWNNPELVDQLLNFLDASSTHQLALENPFTISVLQTDQAWKKFLRRSCPSFQKEEETTWPETKSLLGLYVEKFKPILLLLDLVEGDDLKNMKRQLAQTLVTRFLDLKIQLKYIIDSRALIKNIATKIFCFDKSSPIKM